MAVAATLATTHTRLLLLSMMRLPAANFVLASTPPTGMGVLVAVPEECPALSHTPVAKGIDDVMAVGQM
jgi:hypothetical protein